MEDFGSDFITITDEDGVEYELEILSELDYQGAHYLPGCSCLRRRRGGRSWRSASFGPDEEDGEPILSAITDTEELEAVYQLMMDQLYEDEEDSEA